MCKHHHRGGINLNHKTPHQSFNFFTFQYFDQHIYNAFVSCVLPAGGAAEQGKHCQPHQGGYCRAHPVAEMAEVTVLNNSYDDGTADEHGKLRRNNKKRKTSSYLNIILKSHLKVKPYSFIDLVRPGPVARIKR